ncbi:MAG: transporter [Planctomycetes bacterium]|uniref:transporter n=1 Tax=Candidatus Wunengus sp. YC65 TaxID=3367701 RepID=UPI001D8770D2|nr:transporter [Planctomycetota bacterium]
MKQRRIRNWFQGHYGKVTLTHGKFFISCILFIGLHSALLQAEELSGKKPDLTLSNFFSEGWKFGQWKEPEQEPDQSPRFRLLKIPATVFEREVRMNYSFTNNSDGGKLDEHEWEFEFEMPISRRLLIEVEPTIVSISPKNDNNHNGFGDASFITRVMLLETRNTTLLSLLDVKIPTGNEDLGLGSGMTTISPGIGMWRDIGGHFALQSFLGLDIPAGGKSDEDPDTTVNYGAALTKTVTPKDTPFFGNLTFFVEFNGSSDMGSNSDTTVVSILPGARWNLGRDFWLMPGVEFPITGRDEFENRIWFSVLKDF